MTKKDEAKERLEAGLAETPKAGMLAGQEEIPDYLRETMGLGKDNIDKKDITLPRIKVLQDLSPEVQDGKAKAGELINTVTGTVYGTKLTFIPVMTFKSFIMFKPREEGGGILCSAQDGVHATSTEYCAKGLCAECKMKDWDESAKTEKEKQPKCTQFYNFPVLIPGEASPVLMAMERTKVKAAKKLLSLIAFSGNLAIFAKKYTISTTRERSDKGTFYNVVVEPAGFVTAEEHEFAKHTFEALKSATFAVQVDDETSETPAAPAGDKDQFKA